MIAHYGKTLPAGLGRLTRLPEPVRTAFAYAVIAALAAGLGEVGMVRFRIWAAVVAAAGIGGGGAVAWSHVRRQQRFWVADAWIAHRRGERPAEEVLRERSAILVSPRHRRRIAHSLRRAVADADGRPGRTARVPVDPATVDACAAELLRVADILADRLRAVTPRAAALAEELITDPGSPVYRHAKPHARALAERLRVLVFELEGSFHA